ncbi:hypothetical protein DFP72DRAFT_820393 [Ephemerocybe angulata]|uniref:VASt domain-containing protein n=1 Tax=Ephemerocybe angulata TaxID=980116 RepID=A0A8H6HK07_9AGAR|nr:hypothetical protein DFP72DRAFT_820393 [Tulosesus angulatus]
MAPSFFSRLTKAAAPAPTTNNDYETATTEAAPTDTKSYTTKGRRSASREASTSTSASGTAKSTKSTKSSDTSSTTHQSPRSSFQAGISTLTRVSTSRNRAASNPAGNGRHKAANESTSSFHRKADSAGAAPPPVPLLPDSLKVSHGPGATKSRRNSIISLVLGGGKNKDNSGIVPQPPTAPSTVDTSVTHPPRHDASYSDDDDDPGIPTIVTVGPTRSRESLATSFSTQPGVTVVPPSPLVYTRSLGSSTHSASREHFPIADDADEADNQNREHNAAAEHERTSTQAQAQPVTTPTSASTTGTTTASVLVSIFGRRPRTSSISSAISGIIGGGAKPSDLDIAATANKDLNGTGPTPPTTAATIKQSYFESQRDNPPPPPVPPLPNTPDTMAPLRSQTGLAPAPEVQRKTSSRSLTNLPPPIMVPDHGVPSNNTTKQAAGAPQHARAATSPEPADGAVTMTPIVDSPTALNTTFNSLTPSNSAASTSSNPRPVASASSGGGFSGFLSPKKNDDDTASIISVSSKSPGKDKDGEKKRLFKRSTTRKPTGLASALAATGMAMANPSISAVHATQMAAASTAAVQAAAKEKEKDKETGGVTSKGAPPGTMPYISKSPSSSGAVGRSATTLGSSVSPRSAKSTGRKASGGSGGRSPTGSSYRVHSPSGRKHSRRPSLSAYSDGANSNAGGLSVNGGGSEYYSGNESEGARSRISRRPPSQLGNSGSEIDSDDESDSGGDSSDDELLDGLDFEDEDMPVTGFAVASNKRNADFHELFPSVPEGDYLIEDYGCALQREILIQGRLYISENHICFHANIFGWITDLAIPTDEITSLEKKMTAFVIPNAIGITTRQARYTFASFLSRDTTYDVIYNIWRLARPDDIQSIRSGRGSLEGAGASGSVIGDIGGAKAPGNGHGPAAAKKVARKATQCGCGREGHHYTETAMEATFPGSPEMIHNLMFTSGFIKDFMVDDQKLLDIQTSDWMPVSDGSNLLKRNMSYIKPLNAPMGPKQTKCEIHDEMDHFDLNQWISTVSTTRTPDVPSGGVFSVKTRTCVTWAGPMSSKVLVTTQTEWTGRSFIRGIIERSAIDGQKVYHRELETAMRAYITEHHSEFVPEGALAEIAAAEEEAEADQTKELDTTKGGAAAPAEAGADALSQEAREKQRAQDRNQRAWQWAWDTFAGAFSVAKQSTKTALDLVVDAWDQSSSTTILYFVIVLLVLSNLYTLIRMGKKEEVGRRKEMMKAEERERWVQGVVLTLWEELAAGKKEAVDLRDRFIFDPKVASQLHPPLRVPPTSLESAFPEKWREEVVHLSETLTAVEERIAAIKQSLATLETLDSLD